LAVGDSRGTLHLWDPVAGREVASYRRPGEGGLTYINTIAWLPGEDQVAFGDTRSIVQVWDVREHHLQAIYTPEANSIEELVSWNPTPLTGLAWLPGGRYLASACRSVQIHEASTGKRIATFLDPFANDDQYIIHQVDWSPDWHRAVSVGARFVPGGEGCMYVWELDEMIPDDQLDALSLE
jgi:WD40 repeat protein